MVVFAINNKNVPMFGLVAANDLFNQKISNGDYDDCQIRFQSLDCIWSSNYGLTRSKLYGSNIDSLEMAST